MTRRAPHRLQCRHVLVGTAPCLCDILAPPRSLPIEKLLHVRVVMHLVLVLVLLPVLLLIPALARVLLLAVVLALRLRLTTILVLVLVLTWHQRHVAYYLFPAI